MGASELDGHWSTARQVDGSKKAQADRKAVSRLQDSSRVCTACARGIERIESEVRKLLKSMVPRGGIEQPTP